LELPFRTALVSLCLHSLLGAKEVLLDNEHHGFPLRHHGGNIRNRGNRLISKAKMTRRMPVQYLKRRTSAQCCMRTAVVPEFCQRNPFEPLAWAGMDKTPKVSFQALVYPFSLTIGLGVVCSTQAQLNLSQAEKLLLE
jgi:hypothetical protein